jgi:hypothetical protein
MNPNKLNLSMKKSINSLPSHSIPNSNPNFVIALLIIGDLGESAAISLESLVRLGASRLCVLSDGAGELWIKKYLKVYKLPQLCLHHPKESDLTALDLKFAESNKYSNFGSESFIKLTVFKWFLIRESMRTHSDTDATLFSDLDVFWTRLPSQVYFENRSSSYLALIQDDSPRHTAKEHFCTGVMYWKNSKESEKILLELFENQKKDIKLGKLVPDEPTFNRWFKKSNRPRGIEPLFKNEVVIGHRFVDLCMRRNSFDFKDFSAFHANYVVGENRKALLLRSLLYRINGNYKWLYGLSQFLRWKLVSKIQNNIRM